MNTEHPVRVGEIRPSQILWSFGVGALVDLPNLSVIVGGLEEWKLEHAEEVSEGRLLAGVRRTLGPQVQRLLAPPIPPATNAPVNPFSSEAKVGVPVLTFPGYLRCPLCQKLARHDSGLFDLKEEPYRPDRTRFVHHNCQKAKQSSPTAVPARFLVACRNGHLDDFPWRFFAHRGTTSCKGALRFYETGASLETADLWVKCDGCDSKARSMIEAFGEDAERSLPRCRGRHPHLRDYDTSCDEMLSAILLGASNTWFPVTMSALAVPTDAGALEQIVADSWSALKEIVSVEMVSPVVNALQSVGELLELGRYDPEEIFGAVESFREIDIDGPDPEAGGDVDFKGPEWDVMVSQNPPESHDFRLRRVEVPGGYEDIVSEVVLAERLREANALIGFSRVEPPEQIAVGNNPVTRAPLSRQPPGWVPATEVRGEGVFLRFDAERLGEWESSDVVGVRREELVEGHVAWRRARGLDPSGFPGVRYVLLHSLAHLLLRELSLVCGYSAASIRERIYASSSEDGRSMAGILLYTAAPDSEGTLGGLVELGRPENLGDLLHSALRRAENCGSDPLCAEHEPSHDRSLHGAACHSCLFVPETSCEQGNRYLDRALLVPTFHSDAAALLQPT